MAKAASPGCDLASYQGCARGSAESGGKTDLCGGKVEDQAQHSPTVRPEPRAVRGGGRSWNHASARVTLREQDLSDYRNAITVSAWPAAQRDVAREPVSNSALDESKGIDPRRTG